MVGRAFWDWKSILAHLYHFGRGDFYIFGPPTNQKNQRLKQRAYPILFTSILLLGLWGLFFLQSWVLEDRGYEISSLQLTKSYVLNAVMALIVFYAIYIFRNKYRDLLGFFFLGGSLVKFTLFFIFLYPAFHQDGILEQLEFLVFFVPYGFALILETFFLVKLLNTVWQSPKTDLKNSIKK